MPSVTRDRGCLYYVPWLPSLCVCLCIASLGVWANYTRQGRNRTVDALADLDIEAKNLDRINPALIATAITFLVVAMVIYLMSLWRSFIEAAHDASGHPARGALAFLVISFMLNTVWGLMVMWLVLLLMANTVWAAVLYVTEKAIVQAMTDIDTFGPATWLPSRGLPCPGQCLDLTAFVFIDGQLQFSHTKRERELLMRIAAKAYSRA
ncbi:hypothetical protein TSOC_002319 [Tetrabaena socialis]|uniref:Uncharacterized protein n=1 Tax=Tetrabaena socialis TaxID=47790 RepID=A0A2J8AEH2_9CHLO|nr:hypothetical protein TSOC_002319 [Tetrabaena socialis]|eukprot:PNH10914.1 hypothetical protein TSOC_002319 [Tetrabaena socialis]